MKEHYAHLGLLAVGALALLWYLLRSAGGAVAPTVSIAGAPAGMPNYPNAPTIKLGDVQIEGSPTTLNYNGGEPIPNLSVDSGSGSSGCGCDTVPGQPVSVQRVSVAALQNSADNFESYSAKIGKPVPHVTAAKSAWSLVST